MKGEIEKNLIKNIKKYGLTLLTCNSRNENRITSLKG